MPGPMGGGGGSGSGGAGQRVAKPAKKRKGFGQL
jgi:hypothetical protein